MNFLKRILLWWLKPFDITRTGEVYLRRYHIAKNRFFQVYVFQTMTRTHTTIPGPS
jgi:hypothetical protein